MRNVLIVLLILFLFGAFGAAPNWGWHTAGWGPSSGLGVVVLVLVVLLIAGVI